MPAPRCRHGKNSTSMVIRNAAWTSESTGLQRTGALKKIVFSKEARADIAGKLQRYLANELDIEIGALPAEMLLGFITEAVGGYYYNQGLTDAQAVFARSLDEVNDTIYGLE